MTRRRLLKILHWSTGALFVYFLLNEPDLDGATGAAASLALATHAGMGMLLAGAVTVWMILFALNRRAFSRPGPKLTGSGRTWHHVMTYGPYVGMPVTLLSGAYAGLSAPFVVEGFGFLPLGDGTGTVAGHETAMELHEIAFNTTILLAVVHMMFHIWRHYVLKDNALRIMVPRALHKVL